MKIIAGPCQHESLEQSYEIAKHCASICERYNIEYYFKASFDKANRTSINGKRGLGLLKTTSDFRLLKAKIPNIKIVTDVHDQSHVFHVKDVVDVIQIPAFLCRQTDLIRAAVETGKIVNIKKGQFLAPWDVAGILSKTEDAKEVWITERGTSFGYNRLVVDYTGIVYMLNTYNCDIVLDATHAVQTPGGGGMASGGDRSYVPALLRAGSAVGVNSFFLEVHPDPDNAPSDGPNMLRLEDFEMIVKQIMEFSYERFSNTNSS
jgi:2-dehydro-3-deoxyphosphooctonate aldolase (KDO 8-P synthase)